MHSSCLILFSLLTFGWIYFFLAAFLCQHCFTFLRPMSHATTKFMQAMHYSIVVSDGPILHLIALPGAMVQFNVPQTRSYILLELRA